VVSPLLRSLLDAAAADSFRPHAANEVYVTGTFDDWAKTEKLEKVDAGHFEKIVQLNKIDEKILYKVCDSAAIHSRHAVASACSVANSSPTSAP
jgi:hypothetical protein